MKILLRSAIAVVIGLLLGIATSLLQTVLPAAVSPLANSGAPWALAGILVAYLFRRTGWEAVALGVFVLAGEVAGYYLTTVLRGFDVSFAAIGFWLVAAVVFGAIGGLAAGLLRGESPWWRLAGLAVPAGILLGEGAHLAFFVGQPELFWYGIGSMVLGAACGVVGAIRMGRTAAQWLAGCVGFVVVGLVITAVYGATALVV
ncbi:DUF6518 family protein [Fodinicola feengrottensis]|uniref:Uncharacterized protein n=1 Tax=Fodinicola feengrottensis TaxID=435914 RepID=A0ABN2G231_9ACTN|nr:DUF6518 family protein [Fodinicola feengrottensis]